MPILDLKNINKIYPNGVQAVYDFNLHVDDQEFIVFVGPSGCGKSTTLRMIAGLEEITSGDLYFDNVRVNDVSPRDRDIAMVFQSYALYPHMNVYENIIFSLKLRRVPLDEINRRYLDATKKLKIDNLSKLYPRHLSGGMRQRVALARAIVRRAPLFLLDEPLSNLDAALRADMRGELVKLQRELGCTTIYVTHDQIEAMTMADRIVVMDKGVVQQIGTPKEVYESPKNMFVAGFIGTPPMNFIHGKLNDKGTFTSSKGTFKIQIPEDKLGDAREQGYENQDIVLGIRPEDVYDDQKKSMFGKYPAAVLEVTVDLTELIGGETNIYSYVDDDLLVAAVPCRDDILNSQKLKLVFDMSHCQLFDPDSKLRICEENKLVIVDPDKIEDNEE